LLLDNAQNGGAGDGPNDDPAAPILIGSVSLLANGATHVRQTISFGDGSSLLFNTGPLNQAQAVGWGMFAMGLQFSDTSTLQGWTVGTHAENSDLLWDWADPLNFDEFTYDLDGNNEQIIGTQMMSVLGTLVPEPGICGGVAVLAMTAGLRRARRSA
jgi:hypothetical protein